MTLHELQHIARDLPPTARIVLGRSDHRYREVRVVAGTALYDREVGWTEDHGEAETPEAEFGERRPVLIIV